MAVNLKELADILGISQTTVSRALNGYPEVSKSTRLRVEAAARQYDYSPSTRAKGLATGRAFAIGHVIPTASSREIVNPIFGDFISGAGEVYAENGYEMVLSVVGPNNEEDFVYRRLKSRRSVDGIIVHGPKMNDERIALLDEIDLPFVVHGRASGITQPYTWLDVNNKRAFERATSFLVDLGHRRIALINGLEEFDFAYRRRAGYESALVKHGIALDPELMFANEMTEDYGYRTTFDMLESANPPSAFLASSMITALGVRRAIEEKGLKMGRDVSVITHDDELSYLQNGAELPIFTATRSSVRDAGTQVAKMLLSKIDNKEATVECVLWETELTVGQSTGPNRST
ncbi:MAG: substrate-binding domain-containing protein [Ascidiaceihabitans sp.]|jgi:LacI family transcriptional regulator|nr:substrate-binding domain-containing protein [Ascidiaceihabitans sp.]